MKCETFTFYFRMMRWSKRRWWQRRRRRRYTKKDIHFGLVYLFFSVPFVPFYVIVNAAFGYFNNNATSHPDNLPFFLFMGPVMHMTNEQIIVDIHTVTGSPVGFYIQSYPIYYTRIAFFAKCLLNFVVFHSLSCFFLCFIPSSSR